jgi:hypothetical protein
MTNTALPQGCQQPADSSQLPNGWQPLKPHYSSSRNSSFRPSRSGLYPDMFCLALRSNTESSWLESRVQGHLSRDWNSSGGIATRPRAAQTRNRSSIPGGGNRIFSSSIGSHRPIRSTQCSVSFLTGFCVQDKGGWRVKLIQ